MTPYYDEAGITIYHGDCREVLPALGVDVMVTDPPYGINHASNRSGKFQGQAIDNDEDSTLRDAILATWAKPALVFGSWKRPRPGAAHTVLVWDKGPASGMGDLSVPWMPNWEEIYVIGRGFIGRRDSGVISGYWVASWSSTTSPRLHPNEKPVGLMTDLIAKCPPGTVVDPFMGSGSTLVAAKSLGRRAFGIEVSEAYCEIAARRLAQGVLFGEAS